MSRIQADAAVNEAELLRRENDSLKRRLASLSAASIGISETRDTEAALREVIDSA